jgi:hypothetical protein
MLPGDEFKRIGSMEPKDNIDNCWICGNWVQAHFRFEARLSKKDTTIRGKRLMNLNIEKMSESFKF